MSIVVIERSCTPENVYEAPGTIRVAGTGTVCCIGTFLQTVDIDVYYPEYILYQVIGTVYEFTLRAGNDMVPNAHA